MRLGVVRAARSVPATSWLWYQRDNTCADVYDGNPKADDGYPTSVWFGPQSS